MPALPLSSMQVMIVSLEPKEFIPAGQIAYATHPGILCLHFDQSSNLGSAPKSLSGTLSQVTLYDKPKSEEKWDLRSHNNVEEELYMCDHTVIWSRGGVVLKTFTVDSPVNKVVWCSFQVFSEDPYQFDLPQIKKKSVSSIEGIAAIASGTVHVFTEDGESYDTALPFQVQNVWNFKFGLLFERKKSSLVKLHDASHTTSNNDLTTVFCLQHPLREFSPVIAKSQGSVKYMNRFQDTVVFCEDDFVVTCDEKHGLHTVWRARKVTSEDVQVLQTSAKAQQNQTNSICHLSMSSPGVSPYIGSFRSSPLAGYSSTSALICNSNIGTSGFAKTPHGRNPSLAHLSYTPHSNKAFSPNASSLLHNNTFSPLRHSPHLTRSPCTPMSHESLCLSNSVYETAEPLRPELCFDHMWTESLLSTREGLNTGFATKVFRTKDLCGQTYLAYHLDSLSQLRLVRYSESNDFTQLIFGAVTQIQARDAVALQSRNMFALLDMSGSISLYSGLLKVVKVNVSGIPLASLAMSHSLKNAASLPTTPQPVSTPAHPSRPASAIANMDEVGHLSPVPELNQSTDDISIMTGDEFAFSTSAFTSKLVGLPHVVDSTILIELSGGNHYRIDIPPLCSTDLVKSCLKAIQYMLPGDYYLNFATKWYSVRHAPGALNGRRAEWSLFVECLQEFLGYNGSRQPALKTARADGSVEFDVMASPVIAPKKARSVECKESESKCWEYLLESKYDYEYNGTSEWKLDESEESLLVYSQNLSMIKRKSLNSSLSSGSNPATIQQLLSVFYALHLVYEEQKLCLATLSNVDLIAPLLYRFAYDLRLSNFLQVYAVDNSHLLNKFMNGKLQDPLVFDIDFDFKHPSFSSDSCPCLLTNLDDLIKKGSCKRPFPYIPNVTKRIEWVFKIYDCLFNHSSLSSIIALSPIMKSTISSFLHDESGFAEKTTNAKLDHSYDMLLHYMVDCGIDNIELLSWPPGILLPIQNHLRKCCPKPSLSLPTAALNLLGRSDLVSQTLPGANEWKDSDLCPSTDPLRFVWAEEDVSLEEEWDAVDEVMEALEQNDLDQDSSKVNTTDYVEDNVTRLLFPNDHRLADVYNLLNSSKPIRISLNQDAGVDDREFMEQKEARLIQLLNRSMSLSIGRGMLQYRTRLPSTVESLRIPQLELTGKDTNNATVNLLNSNLDIPSEMTDWPVFHSGVAAAISIEPDKNILSWVHLNKATSADSSEKTFEPFIEHAGALFGLGMNHHLQDLHTLGVHDYLQKSHEMTTIGLLLGLASDKCGTCDMAIMRVLSVHVSALLPDSSTLLDIPYRVQTAAVMAVGLLYLGSGQRRVAEVMLKEIDRSPSSDSDVSVEREAYSLSAGFALGMVTLGKGDNMVELSDMNISDKLFHLMTGKHKRETISPRHADLYTSSSVSQGSNYNQILEGDRVNTEITCPGATIALCLMFLKTNNIAVANWFIAPGTISLLETIKPHHLMLRIMTRSLILWDNIVPTIEWIESHLPPVILTLIDQIDVPRLRSDVDAEADEQTIFQCYSSIITGACIALGLRFAGSQEKSAFDTLLHFVKYFLSLSKSPTKKYRFVEIVGQRFYETCLTSCLLALCMVVAGSGNLKALQVCRFLHVSVESEINYGMQMATNMAMGFLFLGNCRYTLQTTHKAIAALLACIYPVFPSKSYDNRYHLQAFRHFYVMATEKRLLVPIDAVTRRPCYAQLTLQYAPLQDDEITYVTTIAPCLLPETRFLHSVAVDGSRHLPMEISVRKRKSKIERFLNDGLYVQLKPGCMSYIQDPKGHCSYLNRHHIAPSLHRFEENIRSGRINTILFDMCKSSATTSKDSSSDMMSKTMALLRELSHDSEKFFTCMSLLQVYDHLERDLSPSVMSIWQLRLARSFIVNHSSTSSDPTAQLIIAIDSQLNNLFDKFVTNNKSLVEEAICGKKTENVSRILTRSQSYVDVDHSSLDLSALPKLNQLACYIVYKGINLRPSSTSGSSPSKRRSRFRTEDNNLTSMLQRLKYLKNLDLPTSACLQIL